MIARFLDYTSLTEHGPFVRTLKYAAPEQIRNEAEADTDLWALGVVIYEMAAGRRPFRGPMLELMNVIHHDEPEPPSSFANDIPDDLLDRLAMLVPSSPSVTSTTSGSSGMRSFSISLSHTRTLTESRSSLRLFSRSTGCRPPTRR